MGVSSTAKERTACVPKTVLQACRRRGIETEPLAAYACADMSPEGELRHVHLFLKADRLLLAVSALSGEMEFSGGFGKAPAGGKRSFKKCMNILWKPFRSRKYIIKCRRPAGRSTERHRNLALPFLRQ